MRFLVVYQSGMTWEEIEDIQETIRGLREGLDDLEMQLNEAKKSAAPANKISRSPVVDRDLSQVSNRFFDKSESVGSF
jgi:hypothetical protein